MEVMAKKTQAVIFSDEEAEFISQSKLARLATSSSRNQPHVVPVAFEFDGQHFYFSGWNLRQSLKFRNIRDNEKVALVIDDLASVRPWRPRGVEVRGRAEVEENDDGVYVKVTPERKISWGLVPPARVGGAH
jgi:pyridoxamine 5'-phosphate oxidase family protein